MKKIFLLFTLFVTFLSFNVSAQLLNIDKKQEVLSNGQPVMKDGNSNVSLPITSENKPIIVGDVNDNNDDILNVIKQNEKLEINKQFSVILIGSTIIILVIGSWIFYRRTHQKQNECEIKYSQKEHF